MKIYLDIGHGGGDSGVVANGYVEKDLNLRFGMMVRDGFLRRGQTVFCSRETDVNNFGTTADDAIIGSAKLANSLGAELFLSLHFNSASGDTATGAQLIYSKNDSKGRALCDLIAKKYKEAGQPLNAIYTRVSDNGLDYYGVIRLTNMQAIIVESAFVTTLQDIKKFDDDKFCKGVAEALCDAVTEFYGLNDGNDKPGEETEMYYRVRRSWDDPKSQLGAYTVLENAIKKADENPGYYVFDESGKVVYPSAGGTDDYKAMYLDLKARVDEAVRILTEK